MTTCPLEGVPPWVQGQNTIYQHRKQLVSDMEAFVDLQVAGGIDNI